MQYVLCAVHLVCRYVLCADASCVEVFGGIEGHVLNDLVSGTTK